MICDILVDPPPPLECHVLSEWPLIILIFDSDSARVGELTSTTATTKTATTAATTAKSRRKTSQTARESSGCSSTRCQEES